MAKQTISLFKKKARKKGKAKKRPNKHDNSKPYNSQGR